MSKRRFSVEAASRPLHHCEHQERTLTTSAPSTRPRPKTLLKQGKHIGRTFEEVCQTDRPYIDWVFREEKSGELSPNLAALVAYVRQKYGGLMTLGKHRGRYFSELLEQDPLYADWAMNVSCPGDPLRSFGDYAQASSKRKKKRETMMKTTVSLGTACFVWRSQLVRPGFLVATQLLASTAQRACQIDVRYVGRSGLFRSFL